MVEDIVTTDETIEINDEVDSFPSHPYDLPGEWFVLNAQSGHEKKVRTNNSCKSFELSHPPCTFLCEARKNKFPFCAKREKSFLTALLFVVEEAARHTGPWRSAGA